MSDIRRGLLRRENGCDPRMASVRDPRGCASACALPLGEDRCIRMPRRLERDKADTHTGPRFRDVERAVFCSAPGRTKGAGSEVSADLKRGDSSTALIVRDSRRTNRELDATYRTLGGRDVGNARAAP